MIAAAAIQNHVRWSVDSASSCGGLAAGSSRFPRTSADLAARGSVGCGGVGFAFAGGAGGAPCSVCPASGVPGVDATG